MQKLPSKGIFNGPKNWKIFKQSVISNQPGKTRQFHFHFSDMCDLTTMVEVMGRNAVYGIFQFLPKMTFFAVSDSDIRKERKNKARKKNLKKKIFE